MRAAVYMEPFRIDVVDRPDPRVVDPGDAIVRVALSCICGSDLWYYRGLSPREPGQAIGHEFLGVVEEVGNDVRGLHVGDTVIAPFMWSDGVCAHCRHGVTSACVDGGIWGALGMDGGQGEYVRVPHAQSTLVVIPEGAAAGREADFLALADVMGTGYHAAVSARVAAGSTAVVIGDGAVGVCAAIAAARLGASRVIAMSRNPVRAALMRQAGATEVFAERGDDAVSRLQDATDGIGVDAVLECVGTAESMQTALGVVRPGGTIGYVGVPHGTELPVPRLFAKNIAVAGGLAPVRAYLPQLLQEALRGDIHPGIVFDSEVSLSRISDGYGAMHDRRATKVLVVPD